MHIPDNIRYIHSDHLIEDVRKFIAEGGYSLLWHNISDSKGSVFAARGHHSCLWPKAIRFYETYVPAITGTSGHTIYYLLVPLAQQGDFFCIIQLVFIANLIISKRNPNIYWIILFFHIMSCIL